MKKLLLVVAVLTLFVGAGKCQSYFDAKPQLKIDAQSFPKVNKESLDKAYKAVAGFGIPFKYPQAGCESRAYAMALLLDSLRIPNFRVWLFAPALMKQGDNTGFYIYDINDKTYKIRWTYHTAPVVLLDDKGNVQPYVLDPALDAKKPLMLEEWFSKMENHEKGNYTYVSDKAFSFYTPTGLVNGDFYEYVDLSYNDMWAEQALALDYVGRYIYGKYVSKSDSNYDSNFVELITPIISDFDNFKNYVLNDRLPSGLAANRRKLYEQYPQFVIDCKNVYNREFIKWFGKLRRLRKV